MVGMMWAKGSTHSPRGAESLASLLSQPCEQSSIVRCRSGVVIASPVPCASTRKPSRTRLIACLAHCANTSPRWAIWRSTAPSSGLRERSAVQEQERPEAQAREVQRPRRLVGASLRSLDSQARLVLRLQGPRGRLHSYGTCRWHALPKPKQPKGFRADLGASTDRRRPRAAVVFAVHDGCMDGAFSPSRHCSRLAPSSAASTSRRVVGHGVWTFAGADFKRRPTKWRCPSGECKPASVWIKASRLHL
jgi:hypothetical protein